MKPQAPDRRSNVIDMVATGVLLCVHAGFAVIVVPHVPVIGCATQAGIGLLVFHMASLAGPI